MKVAADGDHSGWPSTSRTLGARNTIWCGTASSGLNVFPPEVAQHGGRLLQDNACSRTACRWIRARKLTKTDWSFWSATLADNQADFEAIDLARFTIT